MFCENRKARFDYFLEDRFVVGIVLEGTEVKAIRENRMSVGESFVVVKDGELYLVNSYIGDYQHARFHKHEPRRERKLLATKREISKMNDAITKEGMTIVPVKVFEKDGRVKVEIAIAKGKKAPDKRQTIKEREWARQKSRILK